MIIRKARKNDYKAVAQYLFYAMEDIVFKFLNNDNPETAVSFLEYFVQQENNQYSYENCYVIELENKVIGTANIYDGSELTTLRNPIESYIKTKFNPDFQPEDETQKGEIYLDTLGISPEFRGQGLGSKFLIFLIDEICQKQNKNFGLLVDKENPKAKKLYLSLGFEVVGKKTLMGKPMEHLQVKVN